MVEKETVCIATDETKKQGYNVPNGFIGKYGYFFTQEKLNEYTANVIKQALETAAENIGFVETTSKKLNSEEYKPFITADDDIIWTINKKSITNTFNEIFKKFKV